MEASSVSRSAFASSVTNSAPCRARMISTRKLFCVMRWGPVGGPRHFGEHGHSGPSSPRTSISSRLNSSSAVPLFKKFMNWQTI